MNRIEEVQAALKRISQHDYGHCDICFEDGCTASFPEQCFHHCSCHERPEASEIARKALAAIPDEPEVLGVLRMVKSMQDRAIELFNSGKRASYFNVYDALLYVSEYIEGELGYRLTEEVDDTDNHD